MEQQSSGPKQAGSTRQDTAKAGLCKLKPCATYGATVGCNSVATIAVSPTVPLALQPLLPALLPQPCGAPPLFQFPTIILAWNIDAAARSRVDVTVGTV